MAVEVCDGDRCLLRSAQDGDRGALAEVYRRHRGAVRAFLLRRYPRLGEADADDLAQAVFLALLRRRGDADGGFRGTASARTYLCGIARRLARRHQQRHRVEVRPLGGWEPEAAPCDDPCAVACGREMVERIGRAASALTLRQQVALAGALTSSCGGGAVERRRLCDARHRLRKLLQEPAEKHVIGPHSTGRRCTKRVTAGRSRVGK